MHFNLDNKEYLFTIIEKRKKEQKKAKVCYIHQHFRFLLSFIQLLSVLVWWNEATPLVSRQAHILVPFNNFLIFDTPLIIL